MIDLLNLRLFTLSWLIKTVTTRELNTKQNVGKYP